LTKFFSDYKFFNILFLKKGKNFMIKTNVKNNIFLIYFTENINKNNLNNIKENLEKEKIDNYNNILINLKDVNYIDSTGLNFLLALTKNIRQKNGEIKICYLNDYLKNLFQLTKLLEYFKIYDTEEQALNDFNKSKK